MPVSGPPRLRDDRLFGDRAAVARRHRGRQARARGRRGTGGVPAREGCGGAFYPDHRTVPGRPDHLRHLQPAHGAGDQPCGEAGLTAVETHGNRHPRASAVGHRRSAGARKAGSGPPARVGRPLPDHARAGQAARVFAGAGPGVPRAGTVRVVQALDAALSV